MKVGHYIQNILFRNILVAVCALYVLSPLNTVLQPILHSLSHSLSLDNHHNSLSHASSHDHLGYHEHDFLLVRNNSKKQHQHHEHDYPKVHSHELISFLSAVFNSGKGEEKEAELYHEIELDKHTLPERFIPQFTFILISQSNTFFHSKKVPLFTTKVLIPPPRIDNT